MPSSAPTPIPAAEGESGVLPVQQPLATPSKEKILQISSAIPEPDPTVAEGQRVVLNVLIKSAPEITINPEYVHVRVDFYDVVNEDMVDLTRAVPANRWVTQPVNWQDQSEELLEVTYFLPPQADQEIVDFGHRAYHGYVVKIYYHDQLQDVIAEPASLLRAISNRGAPGAWPISTLTSSPVCSLPVAASSINRVSTWGDQRN